MAPHQTSLPPGFRFHPTDVELVWYYLKRKIMGKPFGFEAISEVEPCKFSPWDLPAKSCLQSNDLEWYFFCPRGRKYSHGSRMNRTTKTGFWKTTGRDRSIVYNSQTVGMKKTLIFHLGKAPQGSRTNWVMYEFRLESKDLANAGYQQDAYVLCKIFEKSGTGPKTGEQYGAPFKEEDWEDDTDMFCPIPLQSIALEVGGPSAVVSSFEVGEPSCVRELPVEASSMQNLYDVGEPSSIRELSAGGSLSFIQDDTEVKPSSMLDHSGVGEISSMQVAEPFNVAESYADGFSLEQLQAFLNSSPPYSNTAYDNMLDGGILLEDIIQDQDSDFHNTYGNLDDLSARPFPERPAYEDVLVDSVIAQFAEEYYVQTSDTGFGGEGNPIDYIPDPVDYYCPFSNNTSSHGLNDVYRDNVIDTSTASPSQLTGPPVANNQLPPASEVLSTMFENATLL